MDVPQTDAEMALTLVYTLAVGNPGTLPHFQFLTGLAPSLKGDSGSWESAANASKEGRKTARAKHSKKCQQPDSTQLNSCPASTVTGISPFSEL